jgi:NitT/TauT family transport system substrate-binding protein
VLKKMKCFKKTKGLAFFLALFMVTLTAFPLPLQARNRKPAELKVALLSIVDALPFYVAEALGFFKDANVKAIGVPVASALERDQLMQSGAIDGMLNEMTSTAAFNREKGQVKIIVSCRSAQRGFPLFRILASPRSGITAPGDLAGIPIGISKNTIIEYVTDRILAEKGLTPDEIKKKSVPVIPERYQLLMQDQLKAATLPDPLAMSAVEAGALTVAEDADYARFSVSVLTFSNRAIAEKTEVVRRFMKAWYQAVKKLNTHPEACRPVLLNKIRVPKNVQKTYAIPPFAGATVPDREQWLDVMYWMVDRRLLSAPLPYENSVTTTFLDEDE